MGDHMSITANTDVPIAPRPAKWLVERDGNQIFITHQEADRFSVATRNLELEDQEAYDFDAATEIAQLMLTDLVSLREIRREAAEIERRWRDRDTRWINCKGGSVGAGRAPTDV